MEQILLAPRLLSEEKNTKLLSEDLEEEVMNFKPFLIKNVLLLSPGFWNNKKFSKESIVNGFYKTDWSNKENYALIYSHDEKAENWVGNVINRNLTEDGKLYGDLEIYDRDLAIKLGKGKAKLGISAKISSDTHKLEDEDFFIDRFHNFSVVYDPACKEAFINLQDGGIITSETSQGSELVGTHVNEPVQSDKKKEEDEEELSLIERKKEEEKKMEEKVNNVEAENLKPSVTTEELNSKINQILDILLAQKEVVLEEEVAEEPIVEEAVVAEEVVEEVVEEPIVEEVIEEIKVEEAIVEEPVKDSGLAELSAKLDEANRKIAELSEKDNKPVSHTAFELSRESLGPGGRNVSEFELNLLKTLSNIK